MMAEQWPDATVYGVDSSPQMIEKASATPSRVQWIEADVRTWQPAEPPDLIYSNAALQWVDGHTELFPRLVSLLAPGGCLAVQVPLSWPMPSHREMRQVLVDGGPGGTPLGTPELKRTVGSEVGGRPGRVLRPAGRADGHASTSGPRSTCTSWRDRTRSWSG